MFKKKPRIITLARQFRCSACAKVEEFPAGATPVCCKQAMLPDAQLRYRGGDPDEHRIDLIRMPDPSGRGHGIDDAIYRAEFEAVVRRFDRPYTVDDDQIYEVYFLKPGRKHGERVGWVMQSTLAYFWKMTPGCKTSSGVANGSIECIDAMISALDEG